MLGFDLYVVDFVAIVYSVIHGSQSKRILNVIRRHEERRRKEKGYIAFVEMFTTSLFHQSSWDVYSWASITCEASSD